jgi:hypothetical protein
MSGALRWLRLSARETLPLWGRALTVTEADGERRQDRGQRVRLDREQAAIARVLGTSGGYWTCEGASARFPPKGAETVLAQAHGRLCFVNATMSG